MNKIALQALCHNNIENNMAFELNYPNQVTYGGANINLSDSDYQTLKSHIDGDAATNGDPVKITELVHTLSKIIPPKSLQRELLTIGFPEDVVKEALKDKTPPNKLPFHGAATPSKPPQEQFHNASKGNLPSTPIIIGPMEYKPNTNQLFINGKEQIAKHTTIRAWGIMMEAYPTPISLGDLSKQMHKEKYKSTQYETVLRKLAETIKAEHPETFSKTPYFEYKTSHGEYRHALSLPLSMAKDLHDDLLTYEHLTVSAARNMVWNNDTPSRTLRKHGHTQILATLLQKKGRIVTETDLLKAAGTTSKSSIKTVERFLIDSFPQKPHIGIHQKQGKSFIFYDSQKELNAALGIKTKKSENKKTDNPPPANKTEYGLWAFSHNDTGDTSEETIFWNNNGKWTKIRGLSSYEHTMLAALIEFSATNEPISTQLMEDLLFTESTPQNDETQKSVLTGLREKLKSQTKNFTGMLKHTNGQYTLLPYREEFPGTGYTPEAFGS